MIAPGFHSCLAPTPATLGGSPFLTYPTGFAIASLNQPTTRNPIERNVRLVEDVAFFAVLGDVEAFEFAFLIDSKTHRDIDDLQQDDGSDDGDQC